MFELRNELAYWINQQEAMKTYNDKNLVLRLKGTAETAANDNWQEKD